MARSDEPVAPPASMVDRSVGQALGEYAVQTFAVAATQVQKLYHDPLELLTRAVQPVLWLVLFGEVMAQVRRVAPGNIPYLDFLAAWAERAEHTNAVLGAVRAPEWSCDFSEDHLEINRGASQVFRVNALR